VETHLVMTKAAQITLAHETYWKVAEVQALAGVVYRPEDIAASISSGSFPTLGMIVAPCSIRSLSEIATGITSNLLTRSADVVLKERRRLVPGDCGAARQSRIMPVALGAHVTVQENQIAMQISNAMFCRRPIPNRPRLDCLMQMPYEGPGNTG
jgi:polyprenyl P-hydroxybenzoate/phenylacrylic acid decarboxylase-like protein